MSDAFNQMFGGGTPTGAYQGSIADYGKPTAADPSGWGESYIPRNTGFGGGGGGITYPSPTVTGSPNEAVGLGDYPATPDVYPGTQQTMPPGTYGGTPGAAGGGGFNPWKILPAAITGGSGLIGYLRGQGGATDKALKEMHQATAPMQAAGNQALAAYTSGTLTGPQQAKVDLFRKQALAKWRQYFANAGIPESSAMADVEAKVDMDTQAYAEQLLQQDFNNAFQATGLTTTNLTNIARQQALQDAEQRKQWEEFMRAMGQLGSDVTQMFA